MSKKWYVLHTYSGYENKVKETLKQRVEMMVRQHRIQGTVIITFYIRNLQLQRPGSGLFFQYPVIIFVAGYRKLYCFHLSLPYVAGYRTIY